MKELEAKLGGANNSDHDCNGILGVIFGQFYTTCNRSRNTN